MLRGFIARLLDDLGALHFEAGDEASS